MTDQPAVLGGWYTDVKYLNKIGVARVTIEMPKDLWEENQGVLGVPPSLDGAKKYVALTRITEDAFKTWASPLARAAVPEKAEPVPAVVKAETKRSSRAHLMCRNVEFQRWISPRCELQAFANVAPEEIADTQIKNVLGIASKTELDSNPEAAARFDALRTDFELRDLVR